MLQLPVPLAAYAAAPVENLDGAQSPSPVLITENDKRITIPFFGKANINIVDLAGDASNHTNVRQNYMSRHNGGGGRGGFGGRGGGGYGGRGGGGRGYGGQQGNQRFVNNNLNVDRYGGPPQQQQQQYNQYMTNGYGNWGSQEPRNKRGQYSESYNQYNGGQSSYGRPSSDYRGVNGGYNGGGGNGGRGYQGGFGGRGYQGGFGGRGGSRGAPIQSAFGGNLDPAQAYPSNHISSSAPAPRGLEALKAGLRSMHQQRQNNANGPPGGNATRYDR